MTDRVQVSVRPGLSLWTRPALLDDTVIDEVVRRDCYRLANVNMVGATVIDCGAHIGVFSTMCAQQGARKVIAVEPQPENLELLRLNCAPFPQIDIRPVAIGAAEGTAYIAGESGGAHHEPGHPDAIDVPQTTLASLLDQHEAVGILKLDMEGGEIDALLGCDHQRLSRVRQIVMETHGPAICPWVQRPHVGDLVEHLLYTHDIEARGFPSHLGLLFAARNGNSYGWPT